jgi:hypothetical protein
MPDVPNIPTALTSNPTPDMSGLGNVKTEGALNKADGSPVNKEVVAKTASTDPKASADSKEVKEAVQKIKLKDAEYSAAEIEALIEKARGADKKFLEASKMKKESMKVFKMAKENPKEFLKITGMDPEKFAYDEVANDIKNKMRDPREVALEEAQKRIKEYEDQASQRKETAKQAQIEKQAKALEQKFHSEIIEAMEAYPELPKNAAIVAELAKAIDRVRVKHGVLLTAKEVAPLVIKDIKTQISGVVKGSDPEKLEALLGTELVDALMQYRLSKLKDPLSKGKGAATPLGEQAPEPRKWKNSHEFYKSIDRAAKEEKERGGR